MTQPRTHWVAVAWLGVAILGGGLARAEALKLGNEGTYPPFSVVDANGRLGGVEPDLAREMCKRMQAACSFVVMDFKALIPSLLQGKFDAMVSQTVPLPERKTKALFTIPIIANPSSFVVPATSHYRFTKAGLQGVRLGAQRGGADMLWAQREFGDAITIVQYDNPDQIRLDLLAKRIDMTLGPKLNWTMELISKPEGKDWKLDGGEYWTGDPSVPEADRARSWLVRKDAEGEALVKRMDAALTSMIKDCTFTRIRQQYLPIAVLPAEATCVGKTP